MSDITMMADGLAKLIEIVSGGEWEAGSNATKDQVGLYLQGVRDVRIADVTLNATTLARMIGRDRS